MTFQEGDSASNATANKSEVTVTQFTKYSARVSTFGTVNCSVYSVLDDTYLFTIGSWPLQSTAFLTLSDNSGNKLYKARKTGLNSFIVCNALDDATLVTAFSKGYINRKFIISKKVDDHFTPWLVMRVHGSKSAYAIRDAKDDSPVASFVKDSFLSSSKWIVRVKAGYSTPFMTLIMCTAFKIDVNH